jgi:fermentation-respiration switch protein FrsA (DUF1100 family)
MFSWLQRALIYFPTRQSRIEPRDAGLPSGQVQTITVRADDGLELRGWHVLPDGQRAADADECDRELALGRQLVLFFSGNAANRRYRVDEFGILTGLGLDVFLVDYRGYGDNAGSPSEARLAADAQAVWDYTTRGRRVAGARIILYGESLGGAVAVRLAADLCQAGTPPGGLILRSTFSSLVDVGTYHYPWLPVRIVLVDRFAAVEQIPRVTCPILQIHGTRDTIIPIHLGRRLFDAAPAASSCGVPKRFVALPRADHNDVTIVAPAEIEAAIRPFLGMLKEK